MDLRLSTCLRSGNSAPEFSLMLRCTLKALRPAGIWSFRHSSMLYDPLTFLTRKLVVMHAWSTLQKDRYFGRTGRCVLGQPTERNSRELRVSRSYYAREEIASQTVPR